MQRQHKRKIERKIKEKPQSRKKPKIETNPADSAAPATQQPADAYLVNGTTPYEVLKYYIGSYLCEPRDQAAFIQTCRLAHSLFQPPLNESAYKILAQAVIDDDRETIKKLLKHNPALVFFAPSKGVVIESQKTRQRFYLVEDVLTIAARRKQIEVLELLLPYCDQIKSTDTVDVNAARGKALSAWSLYEVQTNEQGEEEIIIPKEYACYAQYLVSVFLEESFPNGKLSENAESALASLFCFLSLKNAVKFDDDHFLDTELFLLAIYKAYRNNFDAFRFNRDKIIAFCIPAIGLTQKVLVPETGKFFCEGIEAVAIAKKKGVKENISQWAQEYKLKDGKAFYCTASDAHDGLGSAFFVGTEGDALKSFAFRSFVPFHEIMLSKNNQFLALCAAIKMTAQPTPMRS